MPRPSSPPVDPPGETQHHSLKRRTKRGAGRLEGVGSSVATAEFRVELRKGPGCGALGFTVVGGADSPRGALPIFVRSVLEGGQAAQDGRLQPGKGAYRHDRHQDSRLNYKENFQFFYSLPWFIKILP